MKRWTLRKYLSPFICGIFALILLKEENVQFKQRPQPIPQGRLYRETFRIFLNWSKGWGFTATSTRQWVWAAPGEGNYPCLSRFDQLGWSWKKEAAETHQQPVFPAVGGMSVVTWRLTSESLLIAIHVRHRYHHAVCPRYILLTQPPCQFLILFFPCSWPFDQLIHVCPWITEDLYLTFSSYLKWMTKGTNQSASHLKDFFHCFQA